MGGRLVVVIETAVGALDIEHQTRLGDMLLES